jgi:hypothetical protein
MIKLKQILTEQAKAAVGKASKLVSSPNPLEFFNVRQIDSILDMEGWKREYTRKEMGPGDLYENISKWAHPSIKGYYVYTLSGTSIETLNPNYSDRYPASYIITSSPTWPKNTTGAEYWPDDINKNKPIKGTKADLDKFIGHLNDLLRLRGSRDKSTNRPY